MHHHARGKTRRKNSYDVFPDSGYYRHNGTDSLLKTSPQPLDDAASLRTEADRLLATGAALPRPARFAGYRLQPDIVEFWSADPDRLHRRLRYDRGRAGWRAVRLQP